MDDWLVCNCLPLASLLCRLIELRDRALCCSSAVTAGVYAPKGCDQTNCCCFTSLVIYSSSVGRYMMQGNVAGWCNGPTSMSIEFDQPSSDVVSFINGGPRVTMQRTAGGVINFSSGMSTCGATLEPFDPSTWLGHTHTHTHTPERQQLPT